MLSFDFIFTLIVFFGSLVLFFFDKIEKTLIAIGGALLLIIFGIISPLEAAKSIDYETLILLFGLMLVVGIAVYSGIFSYVNMMIAKKSNGSPKIIFFLFIALITTASFVLNNATVVLLTVPIAIALAKGLSLDGKLLVILLAIFSNIGGTLTLIGDPPNTLIGVQAKIPFMDFVYNLWFPILLMSIMIIAYLLFFYKEKFKTIKNDLTKTFISKLIIERIIYKYADKKMDKYLAIVTVVIVVLTVALLAFEEQIKSLNPSALEVGLIGFIGLFAGIFGSILVSKKVHFLHIMKEVEWDSLLFFAGLFVQVGALEKVGFLEIIVHQISSFSDNLPLLLMVIVWGIGLASTVINNIPFVAMMIPVIIGLQDKMQGVPHIDLLWWALALGSCLGGNGTIIGSASGIIACDLAKKQGLKISFKEFAKVGMPITIISLFASSIYLLGVYYFF
ncbi:MAG: SLC13 family permease [Candidatus Gracilibacteria bacterium]|nr:SLC13 family permease [Candidatus Gracilibacteria bacterium]